VPCMYSSSVRRQIIARLRSGEPVAMVARRKRYARPRFFGGSARHLSMLATGHRAT
jgi:hypothetical protein